MQNTGFLKIGLDVELLMIYLGATIEGNSHATHFFFAGDGVLQEEELEQIMRECLRENGMELAESDIQALSFALYEEAIGDGQDTGELSIDQLKDVFSKHEGLLENLTISLTKWMVPQKPRPKKTLSQKIRKWFHKRFSMSHARNQWQLFSFLLFIVGINIILFATRAAYFGGFANLDESKPNPFYLLSRANGRCLLFNSTMILVVVLRYTVSKMRDLGLSKVLPLDHNIYIHKFIGVIIFVQAWWHSVMHFINFGKIQQGIITQPFILYCSRQRPAGSGQICPDQQRLLAFNSLQRGGVGERCPASKLAQLGISFASWM